MKTKMLVSLVALALAAGVTTSAIAFEQAGGFHSDRYAGVRGYSAWRRGDLSGRRITGGSALGPRNHAYGSPRYDGYGYHGLFPQAY